MFDCDLHLFLNDAEIAAAVNLTRVIQPVRRDRLEPILVGERSWEGTALAYPAIIGDPVDGGYKMWYRTHLNRLTCLATSPDGLNWERPDLDIVPLPDGALTNIIFDAKIGNGVHAILTPDIKDKWSQDARFAGVTYVSGANYGIYAIWSSDGVHWCRREPAILPRQGDRHALNFDPIRGVYMLTCRHENISPMKRHGVRGGKRDIGLWESPDLIHWEYHGVVLRADERDPPGTQLYGMYPFRYSNGFIGLLEVYHEPYEKLDTQIAWSTDGRHWYRVGNRVPSLALGGEGAWDSHWVVMSLNPPEIVGDRLRFWYNGASTKHGSGDAHIRSIGIASLRLDGFVAMEAGRRKGELVTTDLPADCSKKLEVNVSFSTGRFSAEILGREGKVLTGFSTDDCRVDGTDGTRLAVRWGEKATVPASPDGIVKLRFKLYQGSLFGYRWSNA